MGLCRTMTGGVAAGALEADGKGWAVRGARKSERADVTALGFADVTVSGGRSMKVR